MYGTKVVGVIPTVKGSYYAISPERKLKHPLVLQIIEAARDSMFNDQ